MNIEERLELGFECYLNVVISSGNVSARPGNKYMLSKNFVVELPNVANCEIGALLGVTQLDGVGTIVDRYSHYSSVGTINHTYKVPAGTSVILKILCFNGRKKWMIVSKEEKPLVIKSMLETPKKEQPKLPPQPTVIKGDPGPKGDPGKPGSPGLRGRNGKRGERGKRGFKGIHGVPGRRGLRGRRGERGAPGKRGPRGYGGEDGKNANMFCRFHFPGEIVYAEDLYYCENNFTYRYFGQTSKIKRVIFIIGHNLMYGQPIIDVLVNNSRSPLPSPLRLPQGDNVFVEPELHREVIVKDGDEISFPTIIDSAGMAYDLMVIIELVII